jgi:hypothetical protein
MTKVALVFEDFMVIENLLVRRQIRHSLLTCATFAG